MSQGVCSHSTNASQEQFVIFSTKSPMTVVHELTKNNIDYKALTGMYKGSSERSFIVKATDFGYVLDAVPTTLYMQESILFLDRCNARGKRPAWLINVGNFNEEYIGLFQETQLGPRDGQDYTFDPRTRTYYICAFEGKKDKKALRDLSIPQALSDALAGNYYSI